MEKFSSPLTGDKDVFDWEPDLTGSSKINGKIDHLHEAASLAVARDIRAKWWSKMVAEKEELARAGEAANSTLYVAGFNPDKLDSEQVKFLAVCRLLGWHVWPMLDEHNTEQTFPIKRSNHWKKQYKEELESLLKDGLAYDWNNDGVAEFLTESRPVKVRSIRLSRG